MTLPLDPEPWYGPVIDLMLDEHVLFEQACQLLCINLKPEEAVSHPRRQAFKKLLAQKQRRYVEDLAGPANHTKTVLVGRMLDAVQRLLDAGKVSDAAEVLFKVAKVEGWASGEGTTNVFGNLSGEQISAMREEVLKKLKGEVAAAK